MYVETALEGGRVLTVEPDQHHCWMAHKQGMNVIDFIKWELEVIGQQQYRIGGLQLATTNVFKKIEKVGLTGDS